MHGIDLFRRVDGQRNHRAVADRSGVTVKRSRQTNARRVVRSTPSYEALTLHHACSANFPEQRIVKRRAFLQVVRPQRYVANHDESPLFMYSG